MTIFALHGAKTVIPSESLRRPAGPQLDAV